VIVEAIDYVAFDADDVVAGESEDITLRLIDVGVRAGLEFEAAENYTSLGEKVSQASSVP
jgi:hypothetical protein